MSKPKKQEGYTLVWCRDGDETGYTIAHDHFSNLSDVEQRLADLVREADAAGEECTEEDLLQRVLLFPGKLEHIPITSGARFVFGK